MVIAGRFDVAKRLGAGGLAEVFEARDTLSGQQVALKALHDHLIQDNALAERIFSSLADHHVLVIGAGDTSEKAARALLSREVTADSTSPSASSKQRAN